MMLTGRGSITLAAHKNDAMSLEEIHRVPTFRNNADEEAGDYLVGITLDGNDSVPSIRLWVRDRNGNNEGHITISSLGIGYYGIFSDKAAN